MQGAQRSRSPLSEGNQLIDIQSQQTTTEPVFYPHRRRSGHDRNPEASATSAGRAAAIDPPRRRGRGAVSGHARDMDRARGGSVPPSHYSAEQAHLAEVRRKPHRSAKKSPSILTT